MNHYAAIAAALEAENLDAVLLTGEANRFYASGFFTPGADATALVTKKGAVFFTDARYTEAAARHLDGAELREVKPGKGLMDQLKELVFLKGVRRLGFEDAAMSVQSFRRLEKALAEENKVDLYLICGLRIAGYFTVELAKRTSKAIAFIPNESAHSKCDQVDMSAHLLALGRKEVYSCIDMSDVVKAIDIMRVKKIMKNLTRLTPAVLWFR